MRLNGLTKGFKMLIQLLKPVTAEDSQGGGIWERVAGVTMPALLFHTLSPWEGGSVGTDWHRPPGSSKKASGLTVNSSIQTDSPAGKPAPQASACFHVAL